MNRRARRALSVIKVPDHIRSGECLICGTAAAGARRNTTAAERRDLFAYHGILVHRNSWYCTRHNVPANDVQQLYGQLLHSRPTPVHRVETFNQTLYELHRSFKRLLLENEELSRKVASPSISLSVLSDDDVPNWCRLTRAQLTDISQTFRVDINRLFFFYTKCARNDSLRYLSGVFGRNKDTLSVWFNHVLDVLSADGSLVSTHLCRSWTRAKVDQVTPQYIKDLYHRDRNHLVFMTDGSMIYHQKPQNFNRQKLSWSEYKKRNCVSFMPIQALNGDYLVNIGPFFGGGDNSDEFIFKAVVDREYRDWCRQNQGHPDCIFNVETLDELDHFHGNLFHDDSDWIIADRGYGSPANRHHALHCPPNLNPRTSEQDPNVPARRQLPIVEANESRMVTFTRHGAERNYAHIKFWRIIGGIVLHQFMKRLREIVDVLMATQNRCFPPMTSDSPRRRRFAQRVLAHQAHVQNAVQHHVSPTYALATLGVCFECVSDVNFYGVYRWRCASAFRLH